jgi:hypothetical protein
VDRWLEYKSVRFEVEIDNRIDALSELEENLTKEKKLSRDAADHGSTPPPGIRPKRSRSYGCVGVEFGQIASPNGRNDAARSYL